MGRITAFYPVLLKKEEHLVCRGKKTRGKGDGVFLSTPHEGKKKRRERSRPKVIDLSGGGKNRRWEGRKNNRHAAEPFNVLRNSGKERGFKPLLLKREKRGFEKGGETK